MSLAQSRPCSCLFHLSFFGPLPVRIQEGPLPDLENPLPLVSPTLFALCLFHADRSGMMERPETLPVPTPKSGELAATLKGKKAIAVLDRAISFGASGGPLFMEICSALFNAGERTPVLNFLYGLGGRAAEIENIEEVYQRLQTVAKDGKVDKMINYLNLRE